MLCMWRRNCKLPLKIALSRSIGHVVQQPLQGVRVLDLTRIVAGPFCTMILGDLGAEVVKVERPGTGDEARNWAPPYVNNTKEGCYFIPINRNKKSICIDMKSQKGRSIIYELAVCSDVLVENYVPGALSKLQLGYEQLKPIAPQLIYCSITGFGSTGPYSKKPGYDVIASSIGGLLHITGPEGGEPCKPGVALTDVATGLYAHGAILAALLQRGKTGRGQKIDCDLLSTQISTLINLGSNYLNAGVEAKRMGTAHSSIVPYQAFKTRNGFFTIGAGSNKQFEELCRFLNHPELAQDPKYATNELRVKNRAELIPLLKSIFVTKSNSEWSKAFSEAGFPNGPVNSLEDVFNDPHVKEINLVEELEHPTAGKIRVIGPAVKFSEGGNLIKSPPPTLGQHTDSVLKDVLSYDEEKIQRLRAEKIIS